MGWDGILVLVMDEYVDRKKVNVRVNANMDGGNVS